MEKLTVFGNAVLHFSVRIQSKYLHTIFKIHNMQQQGKENGRSKIHVENRTGCLNWMPYSWYFDAILPAFSRDYRKAGEELRECSDRTKDNGFKLKECWFWIDIWKKFFTVRVVRQSHMLPKGVDVPIPESVQCRIGGAFQQPDLQEGVLACGKGVDQSNIRVAKLSYSTLSYRKEKSNEELFLHEMKWMEKLIHPNMDWKSHVVSFRASND